MVAGFRAELPEATIYVYDNNSTDRTVEVARAAGAVVRRETHQGKGHVVRRMFADVEADIYVLVDGDATYDARSVRAMIARLIEEPPRHGGGGAGRAGGARLSARPSHRQPAVHRILRRRVRRDLHRHAVRLSGVLAAVREVVSGAVAGVRDRDRACPSTRSSSSCRWAKFRRPIIRGRKDRRSKLSTWRDGLRILATIVGLYRSERPLRFSPRSASRLAVVSVVLAIPIFVTYFEEGIVPARCRPPCCQPG